MSFRYENFTKVGSPNSNSPQIYSYRTDDSIGLVTTNNYFSDPRADIVTGDMVYATTKNNSYFILVATSDSTVTYYSESSVSTGWASYIDTQYTSAATAFSLPANIDTLLPNNSGVILDAQKPLDITSFYDNGKITGRDGDSLDLMAFFLAIPTVNDQWLDIWIDIGGDGELYRDTKVFPKGQGAERGVNYSLSSVYNGETWAANGAEIYVRSNGIVNIHTINYNFDRTHKAI